MNDIIKIIGEDFCKCIENYIKADIHIKSNVTMNQDELNKAIAKQIKRATAIADRFKTLEEKYRFIIEHYENNIYSLKQEKEFSEKDMGTSGKYTLKEFNELQEE